MDSKNKGNWSNSKGFINTENIQIKLASPKSSHNDGNTNKTIVNIKKIMEKNSQNKS